MNEDNLTTTVLNVQVIISTDSLQQMAVDQIQATLFGVDALLYTAKHGHPGDGVSVEVIESE